MGPCGMSNVDARIKCYQKQIKLTPVGTKRSETQLYLFMLALRVYIFILNIEESIEF